MPLTARSLLRAIAAAVVVPFAAGGAAPSAQADRRRALLAIEEARAPAAGDIRALLQAAASGDESLQAMALRTLGRLERRDVVADLLPYLHGKSAVARHEAANAIAQAFRGAPLPGIPGADPVQVALEALLAAPRSDAVYRSLGRLPYESAEQVRSAEGALRGGVEAGASGAARGLEAMARLHRRVATLERATIAALRAAAARTRHTYAVEVRRNAMAALVAAQGTDAETAEAVLGDDDPETRRLAVLAVAGAGSPVAAASRQELIRTALRDRSYLVRIEAVRGSAAHAAEAGCQPLVDALSDTSLHVVLIALDELGGRCRDDEAISDRLAYEARTPPAQGRWHREAHAFVSLAKRAPDRAAVGMLSFAAHPVWQVRMYAARAAAVIEDVQTLARLATDEDNNVAAAALPPLRRRIGSDSDAAFIAALNRRTRSVGRGAPDRPYDLIRTAALQLKGATPSDAIVDALVRALVRVTEERCETSRDVRLALLERIAELGSATQEGALRPLLRDIDPRVATAAAGLIQQWTGRLPAIEPQVRPMLLPEAGSAPAFVRVTMDSGRSFWMAFASDQAALSTQRFLRLVRDRYYDGLTFHRVVPNFVIQGGSPGANEYCGDCPYWRDEVGLLSHTRGTIGVSTRGRDTGDAQIFVNLVDSPRLDHQYTVFAYVCDGMEVVDEIQEGERMRRVQEAPPPPACR